MSDAALGFLKDCWLVLLYLFVLRIVWVVGRELKGTPETALATAPKTESSASGPGAQPRIQTASVNSSTTAPRKASGPRTWTLVVQEPATLRGTTVVVTQEVTVGRGGGCAISLPNDTFVSTVHARVVPREATIWLEDLGSTNGTRLNGVALTAPVELNDGDSIQIGSSVIKVQAT